MRSMTLIVAYLAYLGGTPAVCLSLIDLIEAPGGGVAGLAAR